MGECHINCESNVYQTKRWQLVDDDAVAGAVRLPATSGSSYPDKI